MSDLTETIQRVLELDKQATGGPWMLSGSEPDDTVRVDMATKPYHRITADANETRTRKANCTLIAEYRTAAPELARALLEMHAALAVPGVAERLDGLARGEVRVGALLDDNVRAALATIHRIATETK